MDIPEFRILGISGGAPYAFVAAWALPERVRAIAVVSGAPPLAELSDRSGSLALYRWLLSSTRGIASFSAIPFTPCGLFFP